MAALGQMGAPAPGRAAEMMRAPPPAAQGGMAQVAQQALQRPAVTPPAPQAQGLAGAARQAIGQRTTPPAPTPVRAPAPIKTSAAAKTAAPAARKEVAKTTRTPIGKGAVAKGKGKD